MQTYFSIWETDPKTVMYEETQSKYELQPILRNSLKLKLLMVS